MDITVSHSYPDEPIIAQLVKDLQNLHPGHHVQAFPCPRSAHTVVIQAIPITEGNKQMVMSRPCSQGDKDMESQTPDRATLHQELKMALLKANEHLVGEFVTPRIDDMKKGCLKALQDVLGSQSDQIVIDVIRVDNTTASISIGGPYRVMEQLMNRMERSAKHSITFSVDALPC